MPGPEFLKLLPPKNIGFKGSSENSQEGFLLLQLLSHLTPRILEPMNPLVIQQPSAVPVFVERVFRLN
jgi:hypothetical protein